jgi:DNA-binding MarR family transcriptional regulator
VAKPSVKSSAKSASRSTGRKSAPNSATRLSETGTTQAVDVIDYGILPTRVGYQIRKAYSRLFQTFTAMLQDIGLAPGQYSVLLLIGLNPGLSQMALADAAGIDRSTIVPITNRFSKMGWIRRARRSEDRRVYSLRLTSQGQSVLDRARPVIQAHEEQLVAGLSQAEIALATTLLARIADGEAREPRPGPKAKSPTASADAADAADKLRARGRKHHQPAH